jgi:hypothetical protein
MPRAQKTSDTQALAARSVTLGGTFIIGAAGAISSQDASSLTGGVVTQTGSEDGRYHVAFTIKAKRNLGSFAQMIGPDDAAFPTTTGSDPQTRNIAATGFDIQFKRTDTQVDTDPASGTECSWFARVALK